MVMGSETPRTDDEFAIKRIDFKYFVDTPDRMKRLVAFLAVAEHLSFTKAAKGLQTTSATVSRKIMQLEGELGVRLFNRNTRSVIVTEAGKLYYTHCRRVMESLQEADEMVASLNSEPRGALRISLPVAFGRRHVIPALFGFLRENPQIALDTSLTDEFVDLFSGGYDAVIRIGSLPDSNLRARLIAPNRRIVVASREYLEKTSAPTTPKHLKHHNCIRYNRYSASGNIWQLQRGSERVELHVNGTFRTDDSETVHEAVLNGHGIGLVAPYICYESLRRGDIVDILPNWSSAPDTGIYIVYPETTFIPPKLRAFINYITSYFRMPVWETPKGSL